MSLKSKQLGFRKISGWGGKRAGSGRPNRSKRVNHMPRPEVSLKAPLHITLRVKKDIPNIRTKVLLKEFKEAMKGAKRFGFYIIHFSIQKNHIHVFAEAIDNRALSLGMRALAGRFAKVVRRHFSDFDKISYEKGSIFHGRYHLHILKTPSEVRNALEYVLLNLSKHQKFIEYIDPYSSGSDFDEWKALLGARYKSLVKSGAEFYKARAKIFDDCLSPPRSWLAKKGWLKASQDIAN
jgi:REP element-mobilizing transposase RayT